MSTAGALTPPLLALLGWRDELLWRPCSAVFGAILLVFVVTYPKRRRGAAGRPAPVFVYLDLVLLSGSIALLTLNAVGRPWAPNAGFYAAGLTEALFVSGLGYLHALGHPRRNL